MGGRRVKKREKKHSHPNKKTRRIYEKYWCFSSTSDLWGGVGGGGRRVREGERERREKKEEKRREKREKRKNDLLTQPPTKKQEEFMKSIGVFHQHPIYGGEWEEE